ncbi:MAG TPA: transcriptional repressor, partial [Flavobacteriaceae bacterium]|nr:transcriptional repressor [Flavobacteriaceae bacterium]
MNLKPETILNQRNIRPTAMRVLVCRFLLEQTSAVSLTDLENAFEKVERTTLFRSLKTFEEKGMVHKIDDGSGIAKYALCETNCTCDLETDLHLHFHCSKCDETFCLNDYKLPKINLP